MIRLTRSDLNLLADEMDAATRSLRLLAATIDGNDGDGVDAGLTFPDSSLTARLVDLFINGHLAEVEPYEPGL